MSETTANPRPNVSVPNQKLHRLEIQSVLWKVLEWILDPSAFVDVPESERAAYFVAHPLASYVHVLGLVQTRNVRFPIPSRYAVVSREKGYVDVYLPSAYFSDLASFVKSVEDACSQVGFQFALMGNAISTSTGFQLSFTNDLMIAQRFWGARGNSVQSRMFASLASSVVPETVTEASPALTLDTTETSSETKPASKGKGRKASKGKGRKASKR